MKQPNRHDLINLRVYKPDGVEVLEGITGVIEYPMAMHRPVLEFEEIQRGERSRYSGEWCITHVPTGMGFGVRTRYWEDIVGYVNGIKDEPALLMLTDKTMTGHPCYRQLADKHYELRKRYSR